jgi:hypothetical protein
LPGANIQSFKSFTILLESKFHELLGFNMEVDKCFRLYVLLLYFIL